MSRYKKLFKEMEAKYPDVIAEFQDIHDKYENDNNKYRDEFNRIGEKFVEIVDAYIDDLCRTSEGAHGANALRLPDLFRNQVRERYPSYDDIGVTVE